jgi:hypothetical protein
MKVAQKYSLFTYGALALQVFLVFFYIHHQSTLIKMSYQKQKHEHIKLERLAKKRDLTHALHASHNLSSIKDFAVQSQMQKVTLNQIKIAPNEHAQS